MKTEFKQVDLTALGMNWRSFRQGMEDGYLTASIKQADGSGTRNVYSRDDVVRIFAFKALVAAGFSLRLAAVLLDEHTGYLNETYPEIDDDPWMPSTATMSTRRHLMLDIGEAVLDEAGMSQPTIDKILELVKQTADARTRR